MNTIQKKRKRIAGGKPASGNKRRFNPSNKGRSGGGNGKKKVSTLDPTLLVKKAALKEVANYESDRTINELPINSRIKECLTKKGFVKPTEIQDKTIESLLAGNDLLGIAQTGTGKTGAFLIPIIEQLLQNKQTNYALVVVPTRELALQVQEEFKTMTKDLKLFSSCFIGGTNINKDVQNLRRPAHIVVGTPGRLLDLANRRALDFRKFETLVLDEFDRMLDMGFVHDVRRIINGMRNRQQTMLFSATLDNKQSSIINEIMEEPVTVKVSTGMSSTDNVEQDVVKLDSTEDKFTRLIEMLNQEEFYKVIIFDETKHRVKRLCQRLNKAKVKAVDIHGDKTQNARQKALEQFKKGKMQVLVATDVAGRGIDIDDVTHVINYQKPKSYEDYIHRIGRTGRAGKLGKAYTFLN